MHSRLRENDLFPLALDTKGKKFSRKDYIKEKEKREKAFIVY